MASCETARLLASALDDTLDRMAIVCTSRVEGSSQNTLVTPLSQVRLPQVRKALDTITISPVAAGASALEEGINFARGILTKQPPFNQTSGPFEEIVFGHVFLLTANEARLRSDLPPDHMTQVHIICPGSTPQRFQASNHSIGWNLRGLDGSELGLLAHNTNRTSHGLLREFQLLLQHARCGTSPGLLTDLTLDITPGQKCCIEHIMGDRDFPTLQAGENKSILVKVRVNTPPASGYSLSSMPHLETAAHPNDLFGELDTMLGNFPIAVLIAKLSYKSSFMPPKNVCSVTAKCELMRHLPTLCSVRGPIARSFTQNWKPKDKARVQKAQANYFASHYTPSDALSAISTEFGEAGSRSLCPEYIVCLVKELRYQTRIFERRAIQNSPQKFKKPSDTQSQHGNFCEGVTSENIKPRDWLTGISDDEDALVGVGPESWAKSSNRRRTTDPKEQVERKKNAKVRTPKSIGETAIGSAMDQEKKVLRNKRSFATNSSRKLTSPNQGTRSPLTPLL